MTGDYFPVWGTCLGFEALSCCTAGDLSVLEHDFDSDNITLPLDFTSEVKSSRIFAEAGKALLDDFAKQPITMNNHIAGVLPETFERNEKLSAFYRVVSTNVDRAGKRFVSTIEGKKLPIYGSQWHPEKPQLYVLNGLSSWC